MSSQGPAWTVENDPCVRWSGVMECRVVAGVWGMGFRLPVVENKGDPSLASERHALNRGPHQWRLLLGIIQLLIFLPFNAESRVLWSPRRDICKVRGSGCGARIQQALAKADLFA